MSADLTLVSEVEARRRLIGHALQLKLLAPYGAWLGCGALRVLRLRIGDDDVAELTVGYEMYERMAAFA